MFNAIKKLDSGANSPNICDMQGVSFALAVVVFAAIIPFAAIYFLPYKTIKPILAEDGLVEWIGGLCWFLASLVFMLALLAARRRNEGSHAFWYVCLMIITFVAGGEEISWGQRIFGFETPEAVASSNLQGEMNIHNLVILDERDTSDGETRKHGIRKLLTFHTLGTIIWFGYLGLLPLAYRFLPPIRSLCNYLRVPVVPVSIAFIAIMGQVCFEVVSHSDRQRAIDPGQLTREFNEHKETLVSFAFFLAAICRFNAEKASNPEQ